MSQLVSQLGDRAWYRGNYAEAYEQWGEVVGSRHLERKENAPQGKVAPELWRMWFLLGYYASYELWEVPDEDREDVEFGRAWEAAHGTEDQCDDCEAGR